MDLASTNRTSLIAYIHIATISVSAIVVVVDVTDARTGIPSRLVVIGFITTSAEPR
jgi:hypothetical protein